MKKLWFALFLMFCLAVPGLVPVAANAADEVVSSAVNAPIDLNRADVADLQGLPGVGPALAERIVAYREAEGPFRNVDQLTEVKGIGSKKLDKFRASVTVK